MSRLIREVHRTATDSDMAGSPQSLIDSYGGIYFADMSTPNFHIPEGVPVGSNENAF